MKAFLTLLLFFTFQSAYSQETSPEETRVLRCNVIKTPWYLKKSYDHAEKITKCWFNKCRVKNARKAELNFCKAVHSCDSLNEELNSPCTEDNKLTPEAKADLRESLVQGIQQAREYLQGLAEDARN